MTTSFRNIFRQGDVTHIEIPIIQRDYAQGRKDPGASRIRKAFLKALHEALTGSDEKTLGLDFVYGEVKNGRMIPLDGQQRLTTLFLLHWYLAARSGISGDGSSFLNNFTYKTRFSARHFCEKLLAQRPSFPLPPRKGSVGQISLSEWLTDQHWYADAWKHDPTIQSMLVTLDDIHDLFATTNSVGCQAAWNRLVAETRPTITFDYLSIENLGRSDDLYIKMNSRGKPLTPFEHFKADFEKILGEISQETRKEFTRKIDQEWSDLLWPLRNSNSKQGNDDSIIDDEFLRLFHFIGDTIIDRHGLSVDPALFKKDIDTWSENIFGAGNNKNPKAAQRDMITALDSFVAEFGKFKTASQFADWFADYFTKADYRQGAVAIFGEINLFGACCVDYGKMFGSSRRAFTLSQNLLLFAILEYLKLTPRPQRMDIEKRLRTLRNLIFSSNNEIRPENFQSLLNETAAYIASGDRSQLKTYNGRQIDEEGVKEALVSRYLDSSKLQETLHRLEDHSLLRGCLAAFDLEVDADIFIRRAEMFHQIFPSNGNPPFSIISGALLASGDYSQYPRRDDRFQFGSQDRASVWLELLSGTDIDNTKKALMKMLDDFASAAGTSVEERLQAIIDGYLERQLNAKNLDWRYYLVKYAEMRSGPSGLYISSKCAMGFDLCMMKERQMNGAYRDPYLLAVIVESGVKEGQNVVELKHYGWNFYKPENRWIELSRTGERIMSCREDGFQLLAPTDPADSAVFMTICKQRQIGDDLMLRVPQVVIESVVYDQEDRIEIAAAFLREFVASQNPGASSDNGNTVGGP